MRCQASRESASDLHVTHVSALRYVMQVALTDGEPAHARGRSRSRSRSRSRKGGDSSSSRSRSRKRHRHKHRKHKHEQKHKHKHHKSSRRKSRGRSWSPSGGDERALVAAAQSFLHAHGGQHAAPPVALASPATAAVAFAVPVVDAEAAREEERARSKAERKKQRAADRDRLEELVPRATGKEARAAERVARRQLEKERDTSPDVATLAGGGDVMGGTDSFAAAVARQRAIEAAKRQRFAPREAEKAERFSAYAAAEAEKMAAFRALLPGGGGPLAIPKR